MANDDSKPGPKPRRDVFGYLDETGLLASPETDQVFGLGLIVAEHPSEIHRSIINYRNSRRFYGEFKFTNIDHTNLELYKGLIDLFFSCSRLRFHARVFNKTALNVKSIYNGNFDRAYNAFAAQLVANSLEISEYIAIMADDVSTKKANNFEKEIRLRIKKKLRRNALFGICRLESHSLAEIQLVDVLLGAVAYAFKIKYKHVKPKHSGAKLQLVKYIQHKLNIPELSTSLKRRCRFGVTFSVEELTGL